MGDYVVPGTCYLIGCHTWYLVHTMTFCKSRTCATSEYGCIYLSIPLTLLVIW